MSSPPTQPLLPADVKPALDCVIPTVLIIICIIIALLSFSFGVLACVYAFIMRAESLSIVHRQPENIPLGDLSGANKAPGPRLSIESEGTLHAGLAKLDEQIQKHVRDNYLRGEEQVDRNKLAVTIACLPFLKHDPEFLTELCAAPNTRQAALRHLIASTVISAIDFTMPNEHTLLPPSVFTFCKSVQSCLESNRNFLCEQHTPEPTLTFELEHPLTLRTTTSSIPSLANHVSRITPRRGIRGRAEPGTTRSRPIPDTELGGPS